MIPVIRYVNLSTFAHAHARWVPDLPVCFTPVAELVQKATTGVINLESKK